MRMVVCRANASSDASSSNSVIGVPSGLPLPDVKAESVEAYKAIVEKA